MSPVRCFSKDKTTTNPYSGRASRCCAPELSTVTMKRMSLSSKRLNSLVLTGLLLASTTPCILAAEPITWHPDSQTIDVDIDNKPLSSVASDFQKATGRTIHIPTGVTKTVSLKFSGKPVNEGVAKILDGLNYHTEGTGNETHIVIVDPNATNTTSPTPTGGRSVAASGAPRITPPPSPANTVYKFPSKDSGKSGGGPGGSGATTSSGRNPSTDRLIEMLGGSGGGSRDGGSKRSSGGSSGSSGPSRPPR